MRQVELAEPVLGVPPNVSRLVEALVGRGYLTRAADPADRRSSLVTLTEHGRARTRTLLDRVVDERRPGVRGVWRW